MSAYKWLNFVLIAHSLEREYLQVQKDLEQISGLSEAMVADMVSDVWHPKSILSKCL